MKNRYANNDPFPIKEKEMVYFFYLQNIYNFKQLFFDDGSPQLVWKLIKQIKSWPLEDIIDPHSTADTFQTANINFYYTFQNQLLFFSQHLSFQRAIKCCKVNNKNSLIAILDRMDSFKYLKRTNGRKDSLFFKGKILKKQVILKVVSLNQPTNWVCRSFSKLETFIFFRELFRELVFCEPLNDHDGTRVSVYMGWH